MEWKQPCNRNSLPRGPEGGACQVTESKLARGTHFLKIIEGLIRTQAMESSKFMRGPHLLVQTEGLVRSQKERKFTRSTHFLESAEGGTCQGIKRKQACKRYPQTRQHREGTYHIERKKACKGHSLPRECRGCDLLEQKIKARLWRAPTS